MEHDHHDPIEASPREYAKFALVFAGIIGASWLMYWMGASNDLMEWLRLFMGVFLIVFGSFKLIGYRMFVEMFPMYDIIAQKQKAYAYIYPFVEVGLGVVFIADFFEFWRSIAIIILMGIGAISIVREVYVRKNKIHCACLGNIIKLPLSTVSLAENVLMVAMAIFMAVSFTPVVASDEPVPEPIRSFSFAASGDFDETESAEFVLEKIGEIEPDFTLALGDLGYVGNGNEAEWCEFVTSRVGEQHPFQLIAGNHDDGTKDGDIREYAKCLPNRIDDIVGDYGVEYYFDYEGIARVILISPDIINYGFDYAEGDSHYQWVADAIDDARVQGIEWVFLGMHKNCVTIGDKVCEIGEDIMNLAIDRGVDVVLQGHEHGYFRSKQLTIGPECPAILANQFNATCIGGEGDSLVQGEGTVIVISGAGGRKLRNVRLDDPEIDYFEAWNGANVGNVYGFTRFDVDENVIDATFVPATEGEFRDSFRISR